MATDDPEINPNNDKKKNAKKDKRVNFLVSNELFGRFQDFSENEYRSVTSNLTDWMATYVKGKEKEQEEREKEKEGAKIKALLSTFSRISDILFRMSKNNALDDNSKTALDALSREILEVTKDPAVCESIAFSTALKEIERLLP